MYKTINIDTKFQWKILTPKNADDSYVGVCDRLKITAEAKTLNELILTIQSNMQALFLDLYEGEPNGTEYFKFAWDHSIEYKVKEDDGYMYINPGPIVIE